jgi:cellulose biosynthesis protein BcsQ
MSAFKILLTSQKGGVGKSTISANLAAFLRRQGESVTLIDFDTHGSSSTWLSRAPNSGVTIQHHILPLDQGGNRPILDARLHLRRAASSCDVVVSDLTWSDSIAGELMFEYDLVIVPTSVSEIELAATSTFLSRHRWVFDSAIHNAPTLLLCPTRVHHEQIGDNAFSKQRFPVSFMLAPPVLESQSARDMFERGFLMDLENDCGRSFNEFGNAVLAARQMHVTQKGMRSSAKKETAATSPSQTPVRTAAAANTRGNLLAATSALSNQFSILGRHRMQKMRPQSTLVTQPIVPGTTQSAVATPAAATRTLSSNASGSKQEPQDNARGIPQFLKRLTLGSMNH